MLRRSIVVVSVLVAFGTMLPVICAQQTEYPVPISIRAVDPSRDPIGDACIAVVGLTDDFHFSKVTDSRGLLPLVLRPGAYDITVLAGGFTTTTAHLEVKKNSPPSIEVKLPVSPPGSPSIIAGPGIPSPLYCTPCRCYVPGQQ
jgi:hypothetical protein